MRYTPEATMDDRSLRDLDRWKDKIEIRLDNRQVFFLFFGSALVACLLFILGVIVGKRLESRGRAVAPEIEDPLALLDRVAASTKGEGAAGVAKGLLPPLTRAPTAEARTPARPTPAVAPASAPVLPAEKKLLPTAAIATPSSALMTATPASVTAPPASPATPIATPATARPEAPAGKGRFTLQLGAFPDRNEADAFAKKLGATNVYVVAFDKPGQGTWFRVRQGEYANNKEAEAAKTAFERQHGSIAYVVAPAKPSALKATSAAYTPAAPTP